MAVDLDSLNKYKNLVYKHLLDAGEITTRWVNERKMYELILSFFPDAEFQYYPVWLNRQSFDTFVPSIATAFEYQGRQHYEVIDFFGGEDAFYYRQRLDKKKKELSVQNGVTLIEWRYDEPITKNMLICKMNGQGITF